MSKCQFLSDRPPEFVTELLFLQTVTLSAQPFVQWVRHSRDTASFLALLGICHHTLLLCISKSHRCFSCIRHHLSIKPLFFVQMVPISIDLSEKQVPSIHEMPLFCIDGQRHYRRVFTLPLLSCHILSFDKICIILQDAVK